MTRDLQQTILDYQYQIRMSKKPYNILTDYKSVGNKAIDAVASCICWHRERKIALKAIFLTEIYYDWFRAGIEVLNGGPLQEGQQMTFDAVNIEKGSSFQSKPILPQRWDDPN